MRSTNFCTNASCSGSVVRMKKSLVASMSRASWRKRSAIGSAHSLGETPAAAAACWTFCAVLVGAR